MKPRWWWRAAASTDALGPHALASIAGLGREIYRVGPSLFAVAAWRGRHSPDRAALIDRWGTVTAEQLVNASELLAGWLASQQIGSTTRRVGVFCREPRHTILVLLATQRLGIAAVLLNTFATPDEIETLARDRALDVISDDAAVGNIFLPIDVLAAGLTSPPRGRGVTAPLRRVRRAPSIAILTSGTTGSPKLVDRRPPIGALDTLAAFVVAVEARRGDRVNLMLPAFHGHGLATIVLTLALGGTLMLRPPADQRHDHFEADWAAIDAGRTDVIVAVPTVLRRLLDAEPDRTRPSSARPVRAIVTGSAPVDSSTVAAVTARFGEVLHNVYGTTEAGVISHAGPDVLGADPLTVGSPLLGIEYEIRPTPRHLRRSTDQPEIGELWVRGGLSGRRWRPTSDLASVDEHGRLRLHGRADAVLVIGGENVHPEALEARINALPGVAECAVRGVPDDDYGTRVELLVRLDADTTVVALRRQLDATLPRTLRPASIVEVAALPRTALGKLQRRCLADITGDHTG